ncbi:MAG: SMC family ATPase [Chloroflexi bacterium]|nr:SMC family ATPase [Chloroflexota bacterium]
MLQSRCLLDPAATQAKGPLHVIPLTLRLRNFMCYRDNVPPLYLEGVHIACLCGENGAGKSSLLDAMTWALWGQARAKSDDDLIYIGKDEMEVDLEFHAAESKYRVIRKRERAVGKRAGKSILELQLFSGNAWQAMSGSGIRETQAKIVALLHLDYETFINSAFLVQGRADEFTNQPPDKRKEVLAQILNLSYYESLAEKARESARRREGLRFSLEQTIAEMSAQVAGRAELARQLEESRAKVGEQAALLEGLEASLQQARREKQALELKRARAEETRQMLKGVEESLARLARRREQTQRTVESYQATLKEAQAIEEGFTWLQSAEKEVAALDVAARTYLELTQRRASLESAIERAKAELTANRRVAAAQVKELEARAAEGEKAAGRLPAIEQALAKLHDLQEQIAAKRAEAEAAAEQAAELRAANAKLKEEMVEIKGKMDQVKQGKGQCPLCLTDLSEDRCANVLQTYEQLGKAKRAQYDANESSLKAKQQASQAAQKAIQEFEATVRAEQPKLQREHAMLKHAADEKTKAEAALPPLSATIAAIEKQLAESSFAGKQQKELGTAIAGLASLKYDEAAHDAARAAYQRLRPFEERARQLKEARERAPQAQQELDQTARDIQLNEQNAAQLRKSVEQGGQETAELPQLAQQVAREEQAQREAAQALQALRDSLGAVQARLTQLAEVEANLANRQDALRQAAEEQAAFEELAIAFSRKGIQALMIESALPEIEEEANRLLGRMTDNRMTLKLETQANLKTKDGVKETLEIRVADELGTRNYELFSGGEAFRINLALRIALSRLLARRAGAPLPTLFIDEGFGTQDPAGRDRIAETINAISGDFERIIVITHIEELKEQFPVRIEVVKTPEGSTFSMN